jgi:hypothetical protein
MVGPRLLPSRADGADPAGTWPRLSCVSGFPRAGLSLAPMSTDGLGAAEEAHGAVHTVGVKEAFADLTIVERE